MLIEYNLLEYYLHILRKMDSPQKSNFCQNSFKGKVVKILQKEVDEIHPEDNQLMIHVVFCTLQILSIRVSRKATGYSRSSCGINTVKAILTSCYYQPFLVIP